MESLDPRTFRHKHSGDDPACPICTHDLRHILERLYVDCATDEELEQISGVDKQIMSIHGYFQGLQDKRMDNTKRLYGRIVEAGINNFDAKKVTLNQAMNAARQLDLIHGRVSPEPSSQLPSVTFVAMPAPAAGKALLPEGQQNEAVAEAQMLPPAAGQQEDDPDRG